METKTFDVNHYKHFINKPKEFSRKYSETWDKTIYFCPDCGENTVWKSQYEDYYDGAKHICTSCGITFHLLAIYPINELSNADVQRLEQLRKDIQ